MNLAKHVVRVRPFLQGVFSVTKDHEYIFQSVHVQLKMISRERNIRRWISKWTDEQFHIEFIVRIKAAKLGTGLCNNPILACRARNPLTLQTT